MINILLLKSLILVYYQMKQQNKRKRVRVHQRRKNLAVLRRRRKALVVICCAVYLDLHFVVHECLSVNPFWLEMQNIILLHVMFQSDHLEKELVYVRFSQLFRSPESLR